MDSFYDEQTPQSLVKTRIVAKYFTAWAHVILSAPHVRKIAYVDLFCGPGCYRNGKESTPLLIMRQAIADSRLAERLVMIFNDVESDYVQELKERMSTIPEVERLKYKPRVLNREVDDQLATELATIQLIPTLAFVDPWGYKGLSLGLLTSLLKDWGSDCIFFFNYNRINMALENDAVLSHMEALFGPDRTAFLRRELPGLFPEDRENLIINELAESLCRAGRTRYVLPFRFRDADGTRTSHHLIFASKHERGYEIMKEILTKESSESEDGVGSFEYAPVRNRQLSLLYGLSRPLDQLGAELLTNFAGATLKCVHVYRQHHVGRPFIKRNYKAALMNLEAQKRISADPPASRRRPGTMADDTLITFPRQ